MFNAWVLGVVNYNRGSWHLALTRMALQVRDSNRVSAIIEALAATSSAQSSMILSSILHHVPELAHRLRRVATSDPRSLSTHDSFD